LGVAGVEGVVIKPLSSIYHPGPTCGRRLTGFAVKTGSTTGTRALNTGLRSADPRPHLTLAQRRRVRHLGKAPANHQRCTAGEGDSASFRRIVMPRSARRRTRALSRLLDSDQKVRHPMLAISLLQFRQLPVIAGDNAPTHCSAATTRHGESLLTGARRVIVGEFCASHDVPACDKRVLVGPPQVGIAPVVTLAVRLPSGKDEVGIVGHGDGVNVTAVLAASTQEPPQFPSRNEPAAEPGYCCASPKRCPREQPFTGNVRRTDLYPMPLSVS
jgi:hypothetical protein